MLEGDPTKLVKCVRENWAQIILSVRWVCFADKPLRLIYFSALSLSGSYWPDYRLLFFLPYYFFFYFSIFIMKPNTASAIFDIIFFSTTVLFVYQDISC